MPLSGQDEHVARARAFCDHHQYLAELRAAVAKSDEDLRIARKHEEEAAQRRWSPENEHAYEGQRKWREVCAERSQEAHSRLISYVLTVSGGGARFSA